MSLPEVIIFDLGRVLIDFDFRRVISNLKRYSPYSEQQIRHYFSHTPLWDRFERGQVSPEDFYQAIKKELKLKGLTFEQFAPLWNKIFWEKPDTISILQRLRGQYRLAMLSNVNVMHWEHIRTNHGFMHWFHHPIASYAVGYRKPDLDIYRLTLDTAGVSPSRAIFIDDVPAHIHAAQSLGIRSHLFIDAMKLLKDLEGIFE